MKKLPSIFNDVIGPVMRGPSSSHTAASWRIANMSLQMLDDDLAEANVLFDRQGQWATNYEEQGTVLGMNGGLLGIDMADDKMKRTNEISQNRNVSISYAIDSFDNDHPNSTLLRLTSRKGIKLQILAASLGGGSFEIREIDGFPVSLQGDQYYLFAWMDYPLHDLWGSQFDTPSASRLLTIGGRSLGIVESPCPFEENTIKKIKGSQHVTRIAVVHPVMPVISGREQEWPFLDVESLSRHGKEENLSLGDLGILYEKYKSGLSIAMLYEKMERLIEIIEASIRTGLKGTHYKDRILHQQSHLIEKAEKEGKILQNTIVNTIIRNVAAIMESKSALEVVVANPTAGSCGAVGAVIDAVSSDINASREKLIKAYFASGLVGAYFAMGPGFSAEEHGCQVECGASAGMAAAGIVELFNGTAEQALGAASMAIQNMIGLICDPIADRVEAPCLGKNTSAALNALASATMAVSGFAHLIPLDQVLDTVRQVSSHMPSCVKCTGCGGLAITPAAQKIKALLAK